MVEYVTIVNGLLLPEHREVLWNDASCLIWQTLINGYCMVDPGV